MSSHADRLAALRQQLKEDRLDGFVVPLTDEHMSEYVGSYAQRLAWLTGFQGSAGSAAVLPEEAAIFTDGRYTIQVRQQVSPTEWSYQSVPETSVAQWLQDNAPNGARIGYSRCVGNDCNQLYAGFLKYDAVTQTWNETVNANGKTIQGSYTTFAPIGNPFPDDNQALAMVGMSNGTLALYDPDTGAPVASNLAVASANGTRSAMMPDWSADGAKVVFASTPTPGQWIDLDGGRIATMTYAYSGGTHTFGDPTFIVPDPIVLPGGTYQNFFFPSFSPDGNLVVFNAARAGWRNFTDARTAGQRLMLADANGAYVTDLTAMNGGTGDFDITWAHWAPTVSNDYYWVVFSSERDYGHRTTAGTSPASCKQNGVTQCKQIWLGAIAKNRLGAGMDPSAPPMWLPGQNPLANNISPYWSVPTKLQ